MCYTGAREILGLEGKKRLDHWARIRTPSRRAAFSLLLILLLLIPFAPSLTALSARTSSDDCGMQCCKRTKVCCCRKIARERQPAFRAPSACSSGCGQLPAVHGPAAGLGRARPAIAPLITAACFHPVPPPIHRSVQPLFPLFERPPPSVA